MKTTSSSGLATTPKIAGSFPTSRPNGVGLKPTSSLAGPGYRGTSKPVKGAAVNQPTGNTAKARDDEPPKKEPKKGSYAEIMARAKQNQSKPQAVGTISHKPKEQIAISYKKEMKIKKKEMRDKKLGIKKPNGSHPSSAVSTGPNSPGLVKPGQDASQTKQASNKPKQPQPTYKGTAHPASAGAGSKAKAHARPQKRRENEYAATDDELDDEDDEEGYGTEEDGEGGYGYGDAYDEESSDDMEAGFDDVEAEEVTARKEAKKEDDREAALEAKLKREKEERKRKMMELAKKAKPQRY